MRNRVFYDIDHAQGYLQGSLVRFDNRPVYVTSVFYSGRYMKATFRFTDTNTDDAATISNPAWDLNPVPLGFLGYSPEEGIVATEYVTRTPRRMWKIGLSDRNMDVYPTCMFDTRYMFDSTTLLTSRALAKSIKGEFVSFGRALEISKAEEIPVAFSRRFATENNFLFYKYHGVPVGQCDKNSTELFPEFHFLKEVLQEDMAA